MTPRNLEPSPLSRVNSEAASKTKSGANRQSYPSNNPNFGN